ncbi:MAG: hypothetical protein ABL921_07775 [Pirellula sp.]
MRNDSLHATKSSIDAPEHGLLDPNPLDRPFDLAAWSGAILFVSDYPLHIWPLHFLAFVPILIALLRTKPSRAISFKLRWVFGSLAAVLLGLGNLMDSKRMRRVSLAQTSRPALP